MWSKRDIKCLVNWINSEYFQSLYNEYNDKEILWDYLNTVEWCENNNYLINKYSFDVLDKFIKLRELIENN